ncbi:hypothetical protein [Rhizobium rhizoryzae]|jgi:hypothetical protein|uniref:hypothetical protein n=1 Tax=Rhizobium rhizoryzae TaxID=451876 RepID=UPI0028A72D59|nr:hypothetical protein [Rhizobium rhizoryzae]
MTRTIFITGSTSGSGLATARLFCPRGLERDGFSLAFLSVVLVFGLVFSGIAVSLLVRDTSVRDGLVTATAMGTVSPALRAENQRIERVISNYRNYRYAAAAIVLIALLAIALGSQAWLHGLAAGLLALPQLK